MKKEKITHTYDEINALKNPYFVDWLKNYDKELKRLSNFELLSEHANSAIRDGGTSEVLGFRSLQKKHAENEILRRMNQKRVKKQ